MALAIAVTVAAALRFHSVDFWGSGLRGAPLMLGAVVGCFYISDLYNLRGLGSRFVLATYLSQYIIATLLAVACLAFASYVWPEARMGRGMLAGSSILMAALGFGWRMLFRRIFILGWPKTNVAVIGSDDEVRVVGHELGSDDFRVLGFPNGPVAEDERRWNGTPTENGLGALMKLVREHQVDAVVVGSVKTGRALLVKALVDAKLRGVEVHTPASMVEHVRWKVPITGLTYDWMALTRFRGTSRELYAARFKRVVDVGLASLGMLASLPILAIAAVAIRCDSRGPVLYRQARVGLNGKEFRIIKLRSMRSDAECSGPVWAKDRDPRATRVGRVLRQLRIDELPQFWNVLAGEMSIIGPRPERPEFVSGLESEIPFYAIRHAVRPGITGWAQVKFRYGASSDDAREKLEYDLFYLKNQSLFLDLVIAFKTVRVVILGSGDGQEEAARDKVDVRMRLRRQVGINEGRVARGARRHPRERRETQSPLR